MSERSERTGYASGLDHVVARFIESATYAAKEVKPRDRWVLLMLFAEAHERAGAAIKALAQKEAGR
ncbi:hypothetical protein [Elioraea sp.]|uniref:hypothetical protein n=1 Tax=Elioraea sp. TaxID=2185103 RepID=UPI0025B913D0|nr:hypothetical protein [Elioraea sp.]